MPLNKDQQNYLVQQMRQHAQWTLGNAALTVPMAYTETEIAQALDAAGFVIQQRPIVDVTLAPSQEMQANQARYNLYAETINGILSTAIDRVLKGQEDNPMAALNAFVAAVAAVQL